MKKKVLALTMIVLIILGLVGCTTADTVSYNLSVDANEFKVYRKLTVTNARTDTIMLQTEGYMSLDNNTSGELVVTIKTGEDKYIKDYVYLNDWTCYTMEQIEPKSTDKYHYEFIIYPERLVPKVEVK